MKTFSHYNLKQHINIKIKQKNFFHFIFWKYYIFWLIKSEIIRIKFKNKYKTLKYLKIPLYLCFFQNMSKILSSLLFFSFFFLNKSYSFARLFV